MNLTQVDIESRPDLDGHKRGEVILSGFLVVRRTGCYLVPDHSNHDPDYRVEVFHPGLEDALDAKVGGWVGGPAWYFDRVSMEGWLDEASSRSWVASISNIKRLVLFRDGETHDVIP